MTRATNRQSSERGVTLLELIIAISLVALISAGMLSAMRTSLMTNEKVTARLQSNRVRMNLRQMIAHQIGGAMPVMAACGATAGGTTLEPFFQGTAQMMRFVSSFSMAEGSRGYPQIVEYQVAPAPGGGMRLLVNEQPYTGPASTTPYCRDGIVTPVAIRAASVVTADNLARCQFSYEQPIQPIAFGDMQWIDEWHRPTLPTAVKVEIVPLEGASELLPPLNVTVNLRTDRDFRGVYADR